MNLFVKYVITLGIFSLPFVSRSQHIIHTETGGYVDYSQLQNPISPESHEEIIGILTSSAKQISNDQQKLEGDLFNPLKVSIQSFVQNRSYFYGITKYFDHNRIQNRFEDFYCGGLSYDGHTGTDYIAFPFYWHQYQEELVDVVSVSPGYILTKVECQVSEDCSRTGECNDYGNYILIDHEDGTQALYAHLKPGTLTHLQKGSYVSQGTLLGKIGFSGNSLSGPHLHLELFHRAIFSGDYESYDPYVSSCITHDATRLMHRNESQEYKYTDLLSLTSHGRVPQWKSYCSQSEELPFFKNEFLIEDSVYFVVAARDLRKGDRIVTQLKSPSGNIVTTWSRDLREITGNNNIDHIAAGYARMSYKFNPSDENGEWTVLSTIFDENNRVKGRLINHTLSLRRSTNTNESKNDLFAYSPNPVSNIMNIAIPKDQIHAVRSATATDVMGNTYLLVFEKLENGIHLNCNDLPSAFYRICLKDDNQQTISTLKIIKQ